ncbi:hypothetical protein DFH07DRAFT_751867 [Mycena maculata]|uniref:HMG domain-containing protein n=1 Tax=Mycena maculata TaxID=230809 RepID=A0AAD7ICE3_9AGAR|nr:hypothetical protein DFH07DRAFT_751867 [Mycena maculata]
MPVPGTQKIDTSIFGSLGYEEYTEAILQEGGSFYQIGRDLFVVNGWDDRTKQSKTSWYHLQRTVIGVDIVIVCRCPLATPDNPCVHERFLSEYGDEMFPADEEFTAAADVVLFSRQETAEGYYLNYFSCPSSNSRSLNSRTVVTYDGDDGGAGNWSCKKDSDTQSMSRYASKTGLNRPLCEGQTQDAKAVSYLPISPPTWAALPTDPVLYERRLPLHDPPSIIPLTETSSCCCSQPRVLFSPAASTRQQTCMIYGLYGYLKTSIEVQTCSHCSHRLIGPDGRELGLFNHNNQRLFTHDLLDEYTSAYTSSETPFVAWVTVVSRRYEVHSGGAQQFVSNKIFRAAWFSYVRLQFLEGDMTCPRCGPSPDNTIWDGVTLAFNRKHLLPTLEPPTTSQPSSVERQNTRYLPAQQLIDNRRLRKLILKVITGPPLEEEEDEEDEEDTELTAASGGARSRKEGARIRARKEMLERLEAIPLAVAGLSHIDEALGSLFDTHFGEVSVVRRIVAPNVYRRFFAQICAEESVLQMATALALDSLEQFVRLPSIAHGSALVDIPAIHEIVTYERSQRCDATISDGFVCVCRWILNRGRMIFNTLVKSPEPPRIMPGIAEKSWIETGCCYSLPKIRERPKYPKLKHDVRNEVGGKRGAKCSKFYSQYGEHRLTGGIMVVWCTHSISYGFHCIPRGEGRNDVFSALITRWEKPPKRVIYDFACALGPYCMTREPQFFSGTQFLIDDFHSVGHTKCSAAAFLKTYCNVDPRLSHINSSAGECGNSGIARVRKSVSYMSQSRAIVYTKVFLSIWNRLRIRSLE